MNEQLIMDHDLGGKARPEDMRDFPLATVQAPVDHPAVFMQNLSPVTIFNQMKTPSCGAHAGNYLKQYEKFIELGQPTLTQTFSPRSLWVEMRIADGLSPEIGSNMRTIFKTLQAKGTCDVSLCSNDTFLSNAQYASPSALTTGAKANALVNRIHSYAFLPNNPTLDGIKKAIFQNGGVLLVIRVNAQMWTAPNGQASWTESDILPLRPSSGQYPVVSWHFVFAHSYDEKFIYFANSWSPAWGRSGHGYFGFDYMNEVMECGIALDLPLDLINQVKKLAQPKFVIGQKVMVSSPVNVRDDATTVSKIFGEQPKGMGGTVVAGPVINHGYVWWNVDYLDGASGWSVEGNLTGVGAPISTPAPLNPIAPVVAVSADNWFIKLLRALGFKI